MTVYSEVNADIQYHVPNCPAPLITRAVKRSVRTLFTDGHVHREYLSPLSVSIGTDTYVLSAPANTEIVQVLNVRHDGRGMNAVSESLLDGRAVDWDTQTGTPTDYFMLSRDQMRIYPSPSASGTSIDIRVSLRPTRVTNEVDTDMLDQYWEEVIDGALSQLFVLDSTPWESPEQGAYYLNRFNVAIEKAKLEIHNDDQPKIRAVKYGGV